MDTGKVGCNKCQNATEIYVQPAPVQHIHGRNANTREIIQQRNLLLIDTFTTVIRRKSNEACARKDAM
jgi:hypothetical protein